MEKFKIAESELIKLVEKVVSNEMKRKALKETIKKNVSKVLKEDMNYNQGQDVKQAIDKSIIDYNYAIKSNNEGLANKIAGNLKTFLDSNNYNWKQDPRALEILGDFLGEAKKNSPKKKKFDKVMGEFGAGTLKTPNGKEVTDKKQALAIAYSESGLDEQHIKLYNIVENVLKETDEKWIQKTDMKKGALHKKLGIPEGDKIPVSLINKKIKELEGKYKEGEKMSDADGKFVKELNLAKTLKKVNEDSLNEKWKGDVEVNKTGEHAGKTIEELEKELRALKNKSKKYQDDNKPVPESLKDQEKEIMFAIRAKKNWKGGVKEGVDEFNFILKVTKANGEVSEAGKYNNKAAAIKAKNMIDPKFKPEIKEINKEKTLNKNSFSKVTIKEGITKNNPKIEKYVNGINELIAQAVDSEGDKIGVVDPTSTWEEPYVYQPIIYQNGALKIVSHSIYKPKEINTDIVRSRDMEYDGIPTLQLLSRMYKKAIKNYVRNRAAEEQEKSLRNNRNGVFGSIH